MDQSDNNGDEEFKPRGAIAFFVALMIFFIITWFALYFELLGRG